MFFEYSELSHDQHFDFNLGGHKFDTSVLRLNDVVLVLEKNRQFHHARKHNI